MAQVKIAIVDDQEMVRDSTASLLRAMGYDTVGFASAEDFFASRDSGFDCILSDVQMPGRSGLDLASVLADVPEAPPVILMTAYPDATVRARAEALGVLALLEKPLDRVALAGILAGVTSH